MKKSFAIFLTLIFAVSACAPATQMEEFPPIPQSTEIPATISVSDPGPSPTPPTGPALLPTFSLVTLPTSDASPLPTQNASSLTTLSPLPPPTTGVGTPFQTSTLTVPTLGPGTPETECFVTASKEGIQLQKGPFISSYKLLPKMELGVIYEAINIHPTFYQLSRDGLPVGWVEYITTGLSTEGPGCARLFQRSSGTLSMSDFPGLCFFTLNSPTPMYFDSALTQPAMGFESSSEPFIVLWKSRKSIFTSLSHAGPSFYSPTDNVSIFGDCDGIPTSATVTTAGWLWSRPDESQGEKLIRLTVGLRLHIEGDRPPDSSGEAAWVQAVVENQNQSVSGWVWSALLSFD